ncbi:hypothetical protein UQW22_10005 [Isoptericola halotolerans]|uniref:hypothetical protein n=1 Tax=Isoptericola halotolerans TaxID=300560 RepID=UPI00388D9467
MTALDEALTAYRCACDAERGVKIRHYSYGTATRAELDVARSDRLAAREALDRAVEAGEDR